MRKLGLYIHIPFCVQKCVYCDFLSAPATDDTRRAYLDALKRELACEADTYRECEVDTVFFGGGTPSLLEAQALADCIGQLRARYRIARTAEITLEVNPKTVTAKKLAQLRAAGINRLSIGLQSADDKELRMLGRIHTYADFLQTYEWARAAGFDNINIDLISGIPGQTPAAWHATLETVLGLYPEHISAYSLIVEEGTPLYARLAEYPSLPDEESDRQMYWETKRLLAARGYERYEISNYAREGFACRHNQIYWQRGKCHTADYVGFGLGATSTVGRRRWRNTADMGRYLMLCGAGDTGALKEERETLTERDAMAEFMLLGLRMTCGVSAGEFHDTFGTTAEAVYGDVFRKYERYGLLVREGDRIRLTDAGIDVSNQVLAEFL
ncbi:MAG: radical SAM family heme chaperone HemW [Roseburia sp.]|nr:radical SAM family heme chaperone HemW [Roseburia sp.]